MKKGRHRRFEEARKLKQSGPEAFGAFGRPDTDSPRTTTTEDDEYAGARCQVWRRVRRRRRPRRRGRLTHSAARPRSGATDADASPRHSQRRARRPCRPWQDHPRRRHAPRDRRVQRPRRRSSTGSWTRTTRSASGASRSWPRPPRSPGGATKINLVDTPGPRRLRRRGRAGAGHGRRRAAAGRRRRGPAAPDPLRAVEGAGRRTCPPSSC